MTMESDGYSNGHCDNGWGLIHSIGWCLNFQCKECYGRGATCHLCWALMLLVIG